ncbi:MULTISPECIES: hypothetical protein [unclassified Sphingomonas]|uniref:hypothetical protein n=1 Tax=unclassified Sphingomonas TaxID=196159 RepID=UPI000700C6D4|nr:MULTISPECIES: hypothetical protein [unclassified Sphingomonas]KQM98770.1 hypothetical protein ASE78_05960 [Sphingomonas sp. Leaf25]KQN40562.1 hypothetical protein ASE97_01895 [Sphingomonas sp. Leaf42]KQT29917.1 hypothetical protein ASG37_01870 [Sphingomonas sp. Leaf407]
MPTDLDRSLALLGDTDEPPALARLEGVLLSRVAADRAARGTGLSMACGAAVGAVLLGLGAAGPTGSPAAAAPLGIDMALAPSTLLAGR